MCTRYSVYVVYVYRAAHALGLRYVNLNNKHNDDDHDA